MFKKHQEFPGTFSTHSKLILSHSEFTLSAADLNFVHYYKGACFWGLTFFSTQMLKCLLKG